jgi:hypothetical protein
MKENQMNKLKLSAASAVLMLLTIASSQAQTPAGPTGMANATPAALCGPGYTPTNISYSGGVVTSYRCSKSIPDQRPCNKNMNKIDNNPQAVGNTLKLSYSCALPVG